MNTEGLFYLPPVPTSTYMHNKYLWHSINICWLNGWIHKWKRNVRGAGIQAWKPSICILGKSLKCSEVSQEVVYSWKRKRRDDPWFHNTEITVIWSGWGDFWYLFWNQNSSACFLVFLPVECVLSKDFMVHFYIWVRNIHEKQLGPHPFSVLCERWQGGEMEKASPSSHSRETPGTCLLHVGKLLNISI